MKCLLFKDEAYHMLLVIFVGSLLPYLEGLDSWLYDGVLDDPFDELFFYANKAVTIDQPAFWDKSYLLKLWRSRSSADTSSGPGDGDYTMLVKGRRGQKEHPLRGKDHNDLDGVVCPVFLKDIANSIISAGKSLKLVQYVHNEFDLIFGGDNDRKPNDYEKREGLKSQHHVKNHMDYGSMGHERISYYDSETGSVTSDHFSDESGAHFQQETCAQGMEVLTLSEIFLVSLVGLVGDGNHIFEDLTVLYQSFPEIYKACELYADGQKLENEDVKGAPLLSNSEKLWFKLFLDTMVEKNRKLYNCKEFGAGSMIKDVRNSFGIKKVNEVVNLCSQENRISCRMGETTFSQSFYPENPAITVCKEFFDKKPTLWDELNISGNFHLPPLNDEILREAVFGERFTNDGVSSSQASEKAYSMFHGTDYTFGFKFSKFECLRLVEDAKALESLFPFPTILPCMMEDIPISELLPFQYNSTLASKILSWIQGGRLKAKPLPAVIIQNCIHVYISKQVDRVGNHILLKMMNDWRLMQELGVLRAVYLLGSGDILQQFLMVIFGKLDKGDSWDDDFELNTILQESIRNSADGAILSAPDSLTVSITRDDVPNNDERTISFPSTPLKVQNERISVNDLDVLRFTYKVSWPLHLIVNMEEIKKYNQVMRFLLKVKHAKFVLDKARRWMWKRRGAMTLNHKHHLLVEQKLLHFVDAFHQYVMDRVFHSAWIELCHNMASAGSLDEVIEVHEAYLLSVQRQCFVAPDKLWALIASRIKSILGLALDFYSIQQTLNTGGAAPAIKARCEMEVDRIEKQFDDCMSFLLRILSFKLNVGQFPHLADLVTRINYNHFYMSDDGNLLTTPSFETSKLGKTYLARTD
uniref:Gamma-tubulin complex component n=1 Tax=Anthurium amnicola TaxID=1678845 RepID=A0A1D1XQE2_9ARAE